MTRSEVSQEIRELNVAYLLLAQKLLKADRAAAMLRLGISGELADMLECMSLSQIIRLASTGFVLCSFRLDHPSALPALTSEGRDPSLQRAHLAILLSGWQTEQQRGVRS